jgi:hypothetical protein
MVKSKMAKGQAPARAGQGGIAAAASIRHFALAIDRCTGDPG